MSDEAEHRKDNPGRPLAADDREALTRDEYQRNQKHLDEVLQLRRGQDLKLLEVLENTYGELSTRFTNVETAVREMDGHSEARQMMFDEFRARQEKHEERIGELEKGYAGLKAWILIVGGITGVASFLAIVLR